MDMPKNYQRKAEVIKALKLESVTTLKVVEQFLGHKILQFDENVVKTVYGDIPRNQDCYLVKKSDFHLRIYSIEEFEKKFEPVAESNLIYAVIREYGFTVNEAQALLSNKEAKRILLANIEKRSCIKPVVNVTLPKGDFDIENIVINIEKNIKKIFNY